MRLIRTLQYGDNEHETIRNPKETAACLTVRTYPRTHFKTLYWLSSFCHTYVSAVRKVYSPSDLVAIVYCLLC